MSKTKGNYGNDKIVSLSPKAASRLRPATNLGSDDVNGVFHALKEIVDNSIDEVKAGYGDEVVITKHKDQYYSVHDNGRGVPMDWNNNEEKYNYELVFMTLNAGGKYNTEEDGTFEFPKGLNGIGASACAFTSEHFKAVSFRDDQRFELILHEGDLVSFDKAKHNYEATGTFIKWKPDLQVFKENDIPFEWIRDFAKEQAVVNQKTKVIAIDETTDERHEFYYDNGIQDYLKEVSAEKELTTPQYFEVDTKGRDREDLNDYRVRLQVAFTFNNEINMLSSYHNSSYLKHGGSPHDAVKSAFAYAIHRYVTDNNLYKKKEKRITWDDVSDSIIVITNTYSMQTSYANQTKLAITNEFIKDYMNTWLREQLEIYFTENPNEARVIAEQVLINKRSSERAETSRKAIRQKLQGNPNTISGRVEGFIPAKIKDKDKAVLTICEGKSALASLVSGRQDKHAIFPLRGKILNTYKATLDSALKNDVIANLFKVIGAGIEVGKDKSHFDMENMNYDRIVIYVDQDEDGIGSILPLLLTAFWNLTPTLVKQGRVYVCETPLYEVNDYANDKQYYATDDKELKEITTKLDNEKTKYEIGYVKGLAELSAEAMAMTLQDDYPNVYQVTLEQIEESIETLEMYMGSDNTVRRKVILDSFKKGTDAIE